MQNPNIIKSFEIDPETLIKSNFSDSEAIINTLESNLEKGLISEIDFLTALNTVDSIEKARVKAVIGEKRMFGGREYINTADGWKYHGKGTGIKAQTTHQNLPSNTAHTEDLNEASEKITKEDPEVEEPKVDINKRFSAFARYTKAVIQGSSKCLIAYGTGGVGKSYTVMGQLKAAGLKEYNDEEDMPGDDNYGYIKITGKMTAPQVYKTMYEHNGKILLFDDCDSVLRDSAAINLFKGGLDSSGDGTIAYGTSGGVKDDDGEKIPKRFKFTGRAIFISNLPPDQVPQPIKSRGLRVNLSMSPEQTMERIRTIAKDKDGNYQNLKFPGVKKYSHEDLESVIDYLDKHKHHTSDLNVRTIGSLLSIKQVADQDGEDWKDDADHMIFSKSLTNKIHGFFVKGLIDENDFNSLYNKIQKGTKGEGSRGGKIIGHTKSGKPIYNKPASFEAYKDFTAQDHKDAERVHMDLHNYHDEKLKELRSKNEERGEATHSNAYHSHLNKADKHGWKAVEKEKGKRSGGSYGVRGGGTQSR